MSHDSHLPALLLPWFAENARVLPWREDADPYHVWISEIMLQQTRVEAVIGYYRRFLEALPTIRALAEVPDDELMKLWQGLGYYSRARNLKRAAIMIERTYAGVFPREYDEIRKLPGIGAYTAGAISSICFDRPEPAVDGNVLRVYSRFAAWDENIDTQKAKKELADRLRPLYTPGSGSAFTQSLMELGACVCLPNGAPECPRCPLRDVCKANLAGTQTRYPVRTEKKARRIENRLVLVLRHEGRYAVRKRPDKGLLAGLWEFPGELIEGDRPPTEQDALAFAEKLGVSPVEIRGTASYVHVFTHVEWRVTGFYCECEKLPEQFTAADAGELRGVYAIPNAFKPLLDHIT